MNAQGLANAGKGLTEGYRLLFGIGAVAVVVVQTALTPDLTSWAAPWLGSLALTVGVLGVVGMLSGQDQEGTHRLWLAWALGSAAGLASFAIVAWRADVEPGIAWPTATLAGITTAVLVVFSETTAEDTPAQTENASQERQLHGTVVDALRQPLSLSDEAVRSAVTLTLAAVTLALHAWQTDAGWYQPTRVLVGSLYVIVVPGWHLSSLFDGSRLDLIERGTLTVVLSLVAVPLGLMWIHFLGGRIDFWAVWTLVLALAVISALVNRLRVLLSASTQDSDGDHRAAPLAWWNSRPATEKAVLLSMTLWMLAIAGLATRISL